MKRCYGCGGLIWPWEDILVSEKLNPIHKKCLIPAYLRYVLVGKKIHSVYMKEACEMLGVEEK